jgi:DNA adenine methylase
LQFNSPLRYPGGKGRLAQFVADLVDANRLGGSHYIEPFAGGAGAAITLLSLEYVSHIHINDLNRSIHAFWHAVLNDSEELCARIRDTRVTMAEWRRQRALQDNSNATLIDLAFSTFFLNRTNRSGIIRGGVIGGQAQDGEWKLNARFNRDDLILRIEKIARLRHRITLYRHDAAKFISRVLPGLPRRALVYLDPPYYVRGKGLYEDHYNHDDHVEIESLVKSIKQHWIVSYDDTSTIRSLYSDFRQKTFDLHYTAQSRYRGSEVMIFDNDLLIPRGAIQPSRRRAA